ncbi:hypothetical protein LTR37_005714 [Vermiconidia calcicola]|uniref:Uncharacterized protein n=1 Tax=Vermiconidia calcicola TaxID=1690605 RepID=A0ACC3NJK9_9PEZI|nr:hypothetical protein LTR37_005714 [Vermiconidia calcicola]
MVSSRNSPEWHVLEFFIDGNDSALTTYARGTRFHIVADADQISKDNKVGGQYRKLVQRAQGHERLESDKHHECNNDPDTDSGIDMKRSDSEGTGSSPVNEDPTETAAEALQCWMFAPVAASMDELAPVDSDDSHQTIERWYHSPVRFFNLVASADGAELEATELESTPELRKQMQGLIPEQALPKYLTNKLKARWYSGSELEVLEASDQPVGTPYHPCRVRDPETRDTFFLKVVDNTQPQPVKRELDILHRVQSSKLHERMRVPTLQGLVCFDGTEANARGQRKAMGFLLTDIPSPKPLTTMLDPSISRERRDQWAAEAEGMKEILHENNIVWGDAKADNFMVDKDDNLWIIDFGGSYTVGWVDSELNETEEGDNMGTEKIVNALRDPITNVQRPEEEVEQEKQETERHCTASKRPEEEVEQETERPCTTSKRPEEEVGQETERPCTTSKEKRKIDNVESSEAHDHLSPVKYRRTEPFG